MKRTLLGVLLCATALGLSAQDNSKEIVKKGWNFGPLPVVGWDSDLGFQYGACVDIFNYGDGTNYPSYNYKVNLEASTYTGGSSLLRCYGDFKTLIPDGKLFFDCTYFNAKKFDFYGFNGYASRPTSVRTLAWLTERSRHSTGCAVISSALSPACSVASRATSTGLPV